MAIDVRTLSFSYGGAPVLQNVSFSARGGEVIALLGPNGVGKSTLFRCLLGFLKPQRGEVRIDGKALSDFSRRALAREIAYIPQSYSPTFNYTVRESVLMGVTAKLGALEGPTAAQQALVMQMLDQLGIAHLSERGSRKISGGERQLMLIARALVQNARVLIMDEPTANLDYGQQLPCHGARCTAWEGRLHRHLFESRPESGLPPCHASARTQRRKHSNGWRTRAGAH